MIAYRYLFYLSKAFIRGLPATAKIEFKKNHSEADLKDGGNSVVVARHYEYSK